VCVPGSQISPGSFRFRNDGLGGASSEELRMRYLTSTPDEVGRETDPLVVGPFRYVLFEAVRRLVDLPQAWVQSVTEPVTKKVE
jgi:hypothetical protein